MIEIQWILSAIYIGLVYATLALIMLVVMISYHFAMRNERKRMIELRENFELFLDRLERGDEKARPKKRFTTRQLVRLVPYFRAIPDKKKHQLAIEYFIRTGLVKVLKRKMNFASRSTRVQIVETLAMFPDKAAQEVLRKGLRDVSQKVRLAAAIALMENDAPWWFYQIASILPSTKTDMTDYLRPEVEDESRVDKLVKVSELKSMPPLLRADAINILAENAGDETAHLVMTEKVKIDKDKVLNLSHQANEPIFKLPEDDIADDRYSETVALADEEIDVGRFNKVFGGLLDDDALPVIYAAGKALLSTGADGHEILENTMLHGNNRARRVAAFFLRSEKTE